MKNEFGRNTWGRKGVDREESVVVFKCAFSGIETKVGLACFFVGAVTEEAFV